MLTALVAGSGAAANATSQHRVVHQARPHGLVQRGAGPAIPAVSYAVTAQTQEFGTNTNGFCPVASPNAPCDGNGLAGDYGTIDRVSSQYSNGGYGNYAPETHALTGNYMAVVSGTGDGNLGVGCPGVTATSNPGETCTGPYALFGSGAAQGGENVFPHAGFTVTDDLYLSPSTTDVAGSLVDDDVELNNNSGNYGIDNIITACAEANGPSLGYVINFGNGSPGSCAGSTVINTDGWYRFVFVFTDAAGNAVVTESVLTDPGNTVLATTGPQPVGGSVTPVTQWGGPGYFWLPSLDMSGMPLANFALQLGDHPQGHTP